jgi:hypothetical protein
MLKRFPTGDAMLHPMSRPAYSIVNALTVVSSLLGSLSIADGPTPEEAHTPLTAVSKRESYVFASTPDGLFRAQLETKRWERLKTPPQMPPAGRFAKIAGRSPLLIYVAMRSEIRRPEDPPPPHGARYGLYLSRDEGLTWELISERPNFGATLLLPGEVLFAVTGADGANLGDHLLRSPDLGKTWRDITGNVHGQLGGLDPDPERPGLVRIRANTHRGECIFSADDDDFRWMPIREEKRPAGLRPSHEFFERSADSYNRYHLNPATLSNYFMYGFGDQTEVHAIETMPVKSRFEFARGARIVIPVRVVFHYDAETDLAHWRKAKAEGHPYPKPTPPTERFADNPGGTEFWGLRVEWNREQVEKYPDQSRRMGTVHVDTPQGRAAASRPHPADVPYRVFDLSPSTPYDREIDLGRFFDFSKPGEYRVQVLYDSGGNTRADKTVWDGGFSGPDFTVSIRE